MGGGVPLILISIPPTQWGGGFLKFWSLSYVAFCVNVLHFSSCVIVSLYHLPFPVPPCIVTLSYIALCCPISSWVHLSSYFYHVLPCPDLLCLSGSALSHPILSYPTPSYHILFHSIPFIPHLTLPYPTLSYPIPSYTAWLVLSRLSYPDEFSGQGLRPYHSSLGPL